MTEIPHILYPIITLPFFVAMGWNSLCYRVLSANPAATGVRQQVETLPGGYRLLYRPFRNFPLDQTLNYYRDRFYFFRVGLWLFVLADALPGFETRTGRLNTPSQIIEHVLVSVALVLLYLAFFNLKPNAAK